MSTNESQNAELKHQQLTRDFDEQPKTFDESRRHFSKAGLAVTGVMLTLASRPVLGQVGTCQAPSGFTSGNVSTHGEPLVCSGRTPGYWGTHSEVWPEPPYDPGTYKQDDSKRKSSSVSSWENWLEGTPFTSVFNCSGKGSIYSKYSLMQVIWLGGNRDPYQLGAHIVSALLNARMGWTPVLTEAQVVGIFNEWNLNGYYEPTASVKWYAPDIVAYLKTTMTL